MRECERRFSIAGSIFPEPVAAVNAKCAAAALSLGFSNASGAKFSRQAIGGHAHSFCVRLDRLVRHPPDRTGDAERPDDLAAALRTAFDFDGPALVEVMTARQELSIPPTITREQIRNFTLYATRTVLSGRGDELIDLAKTNIERHVMTGGN